MKRHITVPLFVPHAGCPNDCSFCNQRAISGKAKPPTPDEVTEILHSARESLGERVQEAELAFFGGSFTAIDQKYRISLLQAARPFMGSGGFAGIRVSTRPDCISREVLDELKSFGTTTIEIGVQSMSDEVLCANGRGHTAQDTVEASQLIRENGFLLGHQMMTGLYRDTPASSRETAKRIATIGPDMVRIYPALVLQETHLEQLWRTGKYAPQSLEQAVELGAELLQLFSELGIPVIRLGLHDEPSLQRDILAGPHHPALRELCENRLLLDQILGQIDTDRPRRGPLSVRVHPGSVSKAVGQSKCNFRALEQLGYSPRIIQDDAMSPLQVVVRAE